jgi:hypothetical protein
MGQRHFPIILRRISQSVAIQQKGKYLRGLLEKKAINPNGVLKAAGVGFPKFFRCRKDRFNP